MGLVFLLCGICVLMIVGGAIIDDKTCSDLGIITAAIGLIALISMGIWFTVSYLDKPREERRFEARYEYVKNMAENYSYDDYGNSSPVVLEVIDINEDIARHRAGRACPWQYKMFSEKIAQKEFLYLPED